MSPLVLAAAFNPVGALRVASAVDFYHDQLRRNPPAPGSGLGFTREELAARDAHALEHLSTHAMLASGTTVIAGLLCLLFSALTSNRGVGPATAMGVVFAILVAGRDRK